MNWLIILGIIVIGFGTYLIYLGSDQNNQKSQQDIIKKIEQTQSNIADLKNKSTNDSLKTEIIELENEFLQWADEFIKNKESKKLLIEKQKISSSEIRIKESDKWLPGFRAFIDVIKKSIDAYNAKTKSNIKYEFPVIPNNIFINFEKNYSGSILFKDDVVWEFIISPPQKLEKKYSPSFKIFIYKTNALDEDFLGKYAVATDQLSIFIYSDSTLGINKFINTRFNLEYLKDKYELTTPEETLGEIARDLIEAQLLQL